VSKAPARPRLALLVAHTSRPDIVTLTTVVADQLAAAGFGVRVLEEQAGDLSDLGDRCVQVTDVPSAGPPVLDDLAGVAGAEIVLALGGDGTFLRAAELARPIGAPLLGVNLGRVGFLAEIEPAALPETIARVVAHDYDVDSRMTLDVSIEIASAEPVAAWALNEASVEKFARERVLEVAIEVDGDPLTSFGCDGVLCSTPTGSTAYAFSAGGPVVWPTVDALLVVPNNAHALFARPLLAAPDSVVTIRLADDGHDAVLCCDGRRTVTVPHGGVVRVQRGTQPVRIVRVAARPFTDRLAAKFALPVRGFRESRR